jgi:phage shock protein G
MLEFIVLILVLIGMALDRIHRAGHAAGERGLRAVYALAGMFALIIKLAPWLLVVLVVCWLLSNRRKQSNTYR